MVTMIGPWIAPTLVLMGSLILKMRNKNQISQELALMQTVGSVGGIIGAGIGFSLPTLYFLDKNLFNNWLEQPIAFCIIIFTSIALKYNTESSSKNIFKTL